MLKVGDKAPAFELLDQDNKTVTLSSLRGKKVLVYFYPKASTPGCTVQSCAVRDARSDLAKSKVVAIGVSPDSPKRQTAFDQKYELGFPLLADEQHAMADAWGVWGEKTRCGRTSMGIIRSAFLVDEEGILAGVWYNISPKDTVPEVMEALR